MNSMSRRIFIAALPLMAVGLASAVRAQGNSPVRAGVTLFQDVRIFDGKSGSLSAPSSVLIKGNVIERISTAPIAAEPGVTVIAGGGRTLMPGLIDAHWHAMLVRSTPAEVIFGDLGYTNLVAGAEATDTLMRGFTTVRDMGGPAFGLKRAIDRGILPGPQYKIKTAFGTDTLFSKAIANRQGAQLAKLVRWYTPAEALAMATSTNGELLQLSGLRNPYPGTLGVVQEKALADLLLVEGNPLENINLIADPSKNFKVIMKDGRVYKNAL
jgi:imidazolonepropionase-like amidohydrolase